jgi:hypothetical protein
MSAMSKECSSNDEGLIQRHCVYWSWFGVGVLQRDEYHR